jgi:hypothetical protein
MLQSGIRATGSTLDPYGPRTSVNLSKFIVADIVSVTNLNPQIRGQDSCLNESNCLREFNGS